MILLVLSLCDRYLLVFYKILDQEDCQLCRKAKKVGEDKQIASENSGHKNINLL